MVPHTDQPGFLGQTPGGAGFLLGRRPWFTGALEIPRQTFSEENCVLHVSVPHRRQNQAERINSTYAAFSQNFQPTKKTEDQ